VVTTSPPILSAQPALYSNSSATTVGRRWTWTWAEPFSAVIRRTSSSFFSRTSWANLNISRRRSLTGMPRQPGRAARAAFTAWSISAAAASGTVQVTWPVAG
jgi:hypothetical protein